MNKWIGIGRLTTDPEIRYLQNGIAVSKFNLAVNDGYGEKQKTNFIPIVAFRKLAEIAGNNLMKGSQILVEGRMQVRNYEDKTGQKRYVTEVVAQNIEFLGSKQKDNAGAGQFGSEVPDEEIPF